MDNDPSIRVFKQYFRQALDFIESKLYRPLPPKVKKKPPENLCSIFFENKGVELINIPRILNQPDIISALPSTSVKFPIPSVTYKLAPPLSTKIFNFNQFVNNLNIDEFLHDPSSLPCSCGESSFADKHHKHIVTGDLRIIENNTLRKLFTKGPKYRPPQPIDFEKAKTCILNGLATCVNNWCNKNGIHESFFAEWIITVKNNINDRIIALNNTFHQHNHFDTLSSPNVKQALLKIHEKFVVVPIDKATGNVSLICKRFYASVIVKELGLGNGNSTNTYKFENNFSCDEIIKQNINDLKSKFGIDNVSLSNHRLPNMYWMPKMHKNPIKARFIVASPKCSIKPLAQAITSAFRLFYKQIESYNHKSRFFTGVNSFWVVQSNKPVFKAINKLNKRNKAKSITTFDFSTLYTKLPHNKLLKVLHKLIDFCFDGGTKNFILINKFGARWIDNRKNDQLCFSKQDIKDAVTYLLCNCYFTVGSKLFCQIIGIPMGSDPAPFFANLFLYFFEKKWVDDLKKRDLLRARKLGNIFRFIDDLSAINDNGEFEKNFREIYPEELELGKENVDNY